MIPPWIPIAFIVLYVGFLLFVLWITTKEDPS